MLTRIWERNLAKWERGSFSALDLTVCTLWDWDSSTIITDEQEEKAVKGYHTWIRIRGREKEISDADLASVQGRN